LTAGAVAVVFEQASIKVEKQAQFSALKAALERVMADDSIESFFGRLQSKGLRIREFESILRAGVLEGIDSGLRESGAKAADLFATLTVADQAQMREFYLSKLETVDIALRQKFRKLYQYY
jgi:hypothetical protein